MEVRRCGPHVLLGKRIIATMNFEAQKLGLNVLTSLASQLGRGGVTLPRRPMAPGAVGVGECPAKAQSLLLTCRGTRSGAKEEKDCYRRLHQLHGQTKRMDLVQV